MLLLYVCLLVCFEKKESYIGFKYILCKHVCPKISFIDTKIEHIEDYCNFDFSSNSMLVCTQNDPSIKRIATKQVS